MPFERPLFITGTTLSAAAAGAIAGISFVGIPPIFLAPTDTLLLIQWRHLFGKGQGYMPIIAITSALCSWANAYNLYHALAPERTYKFIGAGVLTIGVIPFTLIGIMPLNKTLFAMEEKGRNGEGEQTNSKPFDDKGGERDTMARTLIRRWSFLNAVRALFPLAGALLAFDAL